MSDLPTSPDASDYITLRPFGRTAVDIALTALQDLATKLPGVTLREHMTEVLLVETLATEVAELGNAVDRVPDITAQVVLRLFDIDYDIGEKAITTVTFTLSDNAGHTVPAGTEVLVDPGGGVASVVFATDVDLVVAALSTTGTVAATATMIGADANGVPAGTALRIRTGGVSFLQAAELDSDVIGGADPETDLAYFTRSAQRLARLTDALVLPDHFETAALEDANVYRVLAIDLYDGTGGPPYTDTGHITVVVRGAAGNLTGPQKTALETTLEDAAVGNLDVHVIDATVTAVNVAGTVKVKTGHTIATVEAAAEAALDTFLDPNVWPWAATVRLGDVIGLLEAVEGVDYVDVSTVLLGGVNDDLAITGDGPLADAGTLTITGT